MDIKTVNENVRAFQTNINKFEYYRIVFCSRYDVYLDQNISAYFIVTECNIMGGIMSTPACCRNLQSSRQVNDLFGHSIMSHW